MFELNSYPGLSPAKSLPYHEYLHTTNFEGCHQQILLKYGTLHDEQTLPQIVQV